MNNKFSKKRYIKLKEIQFDKNKRKNVLVISKITKTKRKKFIKCYIILIIIIDFNIYNNQKSIAFQFIKYIIYFFQKRASF